MIPVRDLSWQYEPLVDGGKPVDSLKHVSFDIKSGSFVGVIGPTGAGKSTLCMALAGIIPNLADGTMRALRMRSPFLWKTAASHRTSSTSRSTSCSIWSA